MCTLIFSLHSKAQLNQLIWLEEDGNIHYISFIKNGLRLRFNLELKTLSINKRNLQKTIVKGSKVWFIPY
jgi:hypothetical protein